METEQRLGVELTGLSDRLSRGMKRTGRGMKRRTLRQSMLALAADPHEPGLGCEGQIQSTRSVPLPVLGPAVWRYLAPGADGC